MLQHRGGGPVGGGHSCTILGDQLRASVAPADYPRVREAVLALRRDVQTGRVPMSREEFVEGVVRIIERRGHT